MRNQCAPQRRTKDSFQFLGILQRAAEVLVKQCLLHVTLCHIVAKGYVVESW